MCSLLRFVRLCVRCVAAVVQGEAAPTAITTTTTTTTPRRIFQSDILRFSRPLCSLGGNPLIFPPQTFPTAKDFASLRCLSFSLYLFLILSLSEFRPPFLFFSSVFPLSALALVCLFWLRVIFCHRIFHLIKLFSFASTDAFS